MRPICRTCGQAVTVKEAWGHVALGHKVVVRKLMTFTFSEAMMRWGTK